VDSRSQDASTQEKAGSIPSLCFPCVPRTDFSVGANLGTCAITGTATLDGETYHRINTLTSSNFVHLHLIGTMVLPPVIGSSLGVRRAMKLLSELPCASVG